MRILNIQQELAKLGFREGYELFGNKLRWTEVCFLEKLQRRGWGVGEGAVMLITFINNTIACALFFKIVLQRGKKLLSHVAPEDTETH